MGEGEEKGVVIAIPEGIPSILKQFHIVFEAPSSVPTLWP